MEEERVVVEVEVVEEVKKQPRKLYNLIVLIVNLVISVLCIIGYYFTPLNFITEIVFFAWYIFSAAFLILGILGIILFSSTKKEKTLAIINTVLCILPWLTVRLVIDVLK